MSVTPGTKLVKDPNAELIYVFDWSDYLGAAAAITSFDIMVGGPDSTLVSSSESLIGSNQKVQFLLEGGTLGSVYPVTCRITTNETPVQIDDRTISILIRHL